MVHKPFDNITFSRLRLEQSTGMLVCKLLCSVALSRLWMRTKPTERSLQATLTTSHSRDSEQSDQQACLSSGCSVPSYSPDFGCRRPQQRDRCTPFDSIASQHRAKRQTRILQAAWQHRLLRPGLKQSTRCPSTGCSAASPSRDFGCGRGR